MVEIAERRLHGGDGGDVHAVHRNRLANRIEDVGGADQAADAQPREPERFRKRPTDDHVRKRGQLRQEGDARELGIRFVDEHDGLWRQMARNRANRVERYRHARRVVRIREENDARVRRDRSEHLVERKREVGVRHHLHERAARDRRVEAKDLERRLRHDRFGHRSAAVRPQLRHRQRHDAFVEAVGDRDAVGRHAQVARDDVGRRGVRRVEADLIGPHRRKGFENARRAAAGVLVLMQPQAVVQLRRFLVVTHYLSLNSTDSACACSPSARASGRIVSASRARPGRVTRCTAITRTKSAAFRPPRKRAAPPVGNT